MVIMGSDKCFECGNENLIFICSGISSDFYTCTHCDALVEIPITEEKKNGNK